MPDWEINSGSGGSWETFAEAGISSVEVNFGNAITDELTFLVDVDSADADGPFTYADTVQVRYDGTVYFVGVYVGAQRVVTTGDERLQHRAVSPWIYLEHQTYKQDWKSWNTGSEALETLSLAQYVLGHKLDGSREHSGAVITDAMTQASNGGARYQVGTVDPAVEMPWDETKDLKCAEVIKRMLRWTPNAVCYFDYATSPPTLHCRTTLTDYTKTVPDSDGLNIVRRDDLQVQGVIIRYRFTETVTPGSGDQKVYERYAEEKYPGGATAGDLRVAEFTIDLGSVNKTITAQKVVTEDVPADLNDKAWWKERVPFLKDIPDADFTIKNGARTNTLNLPRIVLEGSVPDWANKQQEEAEIAAQVDYKVKDGGAVIKEVENEAISVQHTETDASSITYTKADESDDLEPQPSGLAQAYYNAANVLHFEGQISLPFDEVPTANLMGRKIKITGARAEWASMHAAVQQVRADITAGVLHVTFGYPKHLLIDDMMELQRPNRFRARSTGFRRRETGEADKQNGAVGDKAKHKNSNRGNGTDVTRTRGFTVSRVSSSAVKIQGGTGRVQDQDFTIATVASHTFSGRYIRLRFSKSGGNALTSPTFISSATEAAETSSNLYYTIADLGATPASDPIDQRIEGALYDRNTSPSDNEHAHPYWDDTDDRHKWREPQVHE